MIDCTEFSILHKDSRNSVSRPAFECRLSISWRLTILSLTSTMNQTSTLQTAIEALSQEGQDFLFDLIQKCRITQPSQAIQQRREEIRQNGIAVMEAAKNGTAKRGTVAELIADILADDEE